ncbi:hypothetical protein [Rheinheimera aquimaris]|uniref:hypothetical protein n=1 Tax=Rheinheimera aquimaris TaxID=412437 RepID=UPI003A96929A
MATRTVIRAPEELCIYSNLTRTETLNFLNKIDSKLLILQELIIVDLSSVKLATAAASLLLFAVINRAQLLLEDTNIVRFRLPNKTVNSEGHRYIVKTGLSRALQSGTISKLEELKNDEQYFQSSAEPNIHLFSTIEMLQSKANLNDEQLLLLSSGISEAMLNVSHHAYEHTDFASHVKTIGKRWWQCAWFDHLTDSTVFIIYDLGVGIFKSFTNFQKPTSPIYELEVMRTAFTLGKTRFGTPERGKGSEDIKAPIHSMYAKRERLLVYSGRAEYTFTSDSEVAQTDYNPEFIPGTLVQWELSPIREKSDD